MVKKTDRATGKKMLSKSCGRAPVPKRIFFTGKKMIRIRPVDFHHQPWQTALAGGQDTDR
jgi:hypothetical protein